MYTVVEGTARLWSGTISGERCHDRSRIQGRILTICLPRTNIDLGPVFEGALRLPSLLEQFAVSREPLDINKLSIDEVMLNTGPKSAEQRLASHVALELLGEVPESWLYIGKVCINGITLCLPMALAELGEIIPNRLVDEVLPQLCDQAFEGHCSGFVFSGHIA